MLDFDPERLQAASAMLRAGGREMTPEQVREYCYQLIASYREAASNAGRLDIAALPDDEIWNRIISLVGRMEGTDDPPPLTA